jgi:hypothetical protein
MALCVTLTNDRVDRRFSGSRRLRPKTGPEEEAVPFLKLRNLRQFFLRA